MKSKQIESNNSGMSWDDSQKMWKCSEDIFNDYITAHPKAESYLNKPIFMYDELSIVCGDDQVTGSFARSSADDIFDVDEMSDTGIEDILPSINSTQVNTHMLTSPHVMKHGKRPRAMDEFGEKMDKLSEKIGEVATAMRSSNSREHAAYLYAEVIRSEGFDELIIEEEFDYLNENEKVARSFLVRNTGGRQRWLNKFQQLEEEKHK